MASIVGAGPVSVEPVVAAAANTNFAAVVGIVIIAMVLANIAKGETEWPIDVDVMEDEE